MGAAADGRPSMDHLAGDEQPGMMPDGYYCRLANAPRPLHPEEPDGLLGLDEPTCL